MKRMKSIGAWIVTLLFTLPILNLIRIFMERPSLKDCLQLPMLAVVVMWLGVVAGFLVAFLTLLRICSRHRRLAFSLLVATAAFFRLAHDKVFATPYPVLNALPWICLLTLLMAELRELFRFLTGQRDLKACFPCETKALRALPGDVAQGMARKMHGRSIDHVLLSVTILFVATTVAIFARHIVLSPLPPAAAPIMLSFLFACLLLGLTVGTFSALDDFTRLLSRTDAASPPTRRDLLSFRSLLCAFFACWVSVRLLIHGYSYGHSFQEHDLVLVCLFGASYGFLIASHVLSAALLRITAQELHGEPL